MTNPNQQTLKYKQTDLIIAQSSQVNAHHNISLDAQNNLNLQAAQNVDTLNSKNSGSSASLGVIFGTDGFLPKSMPLEKQYQF